MKIRLADLPVEWQDEYSDFVSAFEDKSDGESVMNVAFSDTIPECHGIQYFESVAAHTLRLPGGEMLCADEDWSDVTGYFTEKNGEYALALAALCSRFSYFSTLLLHASCVDVGGEGVVFAGFSGVGKTTQAKLWQEHLGAEIINGDKILLKEENGEAYAYGLPWKGSSEFCLNKKTKLRAVVVLRQAKENRITKLVPSASNEYFLPHIFMPAWDRKCVCNMLDTYEKLLAAVPVYLLECRPDEDAVRLVYETTEWKN